MSRLRKPASPFRYFNSSPEVIRLVVPMYVRFPLALRNVEDLLFERGIDICHETVKLWWNRFGPLSFPQQRACEDACRGIDRNTECKAHLATVEKVDDVVSAENAANPYLETGGFNSEPRQEWRQQDERGVVSHCDCDNVISSCWIKAVVVQD
jgi:hypothetical protein